MLRWKTIEHYRQRIEGHWYIKPTCISLIGSFGIGKTSLCSTMQLLAERSIPGKNGLVEALSHRSLAAPLHRAFGEIFSRKWHYLTVEEKRPYREFMSNLAYEARLVNPNTWVEAMFSDGGVPAVLLIDDLRFLQEEEILRDLYGDRFYTVQLTDTLNVEEEVYSTSEGTLGREYEVGYRHSETGEYRKLSSTLNILSAMTNQVLQLK